MKTYRIALCFEVDAVSAEAAERTILGPIFLLPHVRHTATTTTEIGKPPDCCGGPLEPMPNGGTYCERCDTRYDEDGNSY